VIASKHIFGGGPYSVAGSNALRTVGQVRWPISEISIAPAKGGTRTKDGVYRPAIVEPFLPKRITDPYHPGGNSLCYMIQTAHLMGCDPIYAIGFTLASGSTYFFGRENPVTRRSSIYDTERAIHWLRWYQSRYPGRVRLWPGFNGPVYKVLEVVDEDEAEALGGAQPRDERDPQGVDVQAVEQLRPDQGDRPVHADEEQSLRDW
jgi:hypothetical protein